MTSCLLVPPAAAGSLGDAAMVSGAAHFLHGAGFDRVLLMAVGDPGGWAATPYVDQIVSLSPFGPETARALRDDHGVTEVFVIGADIVDGAYGAGPVIPRLRVLNFAARAGLGATLVGFSLNETPRPESVAGLRNLHRAVRICAREPVSRARLRQHLGRDTVLTADAAFLLPADASTTAMAPAFQWVEEQRGAGHAVFGFNANAIHGEAHDGFLERCAACVEALISEQDGAVILVPHDTRGDESDVVWVGRIAAALPDGLAGRCHVVAGQGLSPGSVRALVRDLDFVVSGRMHLAIACLAEGVPVAGVTYQGKFEGLFGYFELGDMLIAADAAFDDNGDGLAAFVLACTADLAGARERIMDHRERVVALAERNFLR